MLYKIGRFILGPIFKWYYNPKIIGKNNLKQNSGLIIAGNHIHLYDQCHTIISTKRMITFMAKKEYFDSKKTAWFFKGVGCIPVDRKNKDNSAVEKALEVLDNKGIIGIFPEGTRNALKQDRIDDLYNNSFKDLDYDEFVKRIKENNPKYSQLKYLEKLYNEKVISKEEVDKYIFDPDKSLIELYKRKIIKYKDYLDSNLLDLKFGAVSMAKKTDSYIVPVCITGDYKFRSKNLKVNYGKPFKVTDDLEESNIKLRDELIKLMEENLKESK